MTVVVFWLGPKFGVCLSEDFTVLLIAEEPADNWTCMNVLEVVKFGT